MRLAVQEHTTNCQQDKTPIQNPESLALCTLQDLRTGRRLTVENFRSGSESGLIDVSDRRRFLESEKSARQSHDSSAKSPAGEACAVHVRRHDKDVHEKI